MPVTRIPLTTMCAADRVAAAAAKVENVATGLHQRHEALDPLLIVPFGSTTIRIPGTRMPVIVCRDARCQIGHLGLAVFRAHQNSAQEEGIVAGRPTNLNPPDLQKG